MEEGQGAAPGILPSQRISDIFNELAAIHRREPTHESIARARQLKSEMDWLQSPLTKGRHPRERDNPLWTREERGAQMLQKADVDANLGYGLPARAESMKGIPGLKDIPAGRTAMYAGDRWLKTSRGWTRVGGKPGPKDLDWVLKQHFDVKMEQPPEMRGILDDITGSRPEAAVHEIKEQGGWGSLPTDIEARRVVAKHVRQRVAMGKASTSEIVWLNLHDMKVRSPGKFRYRR
jgi:hypothetical protein